MSWLEKRMRGFLTGEYRAVLFELDGRTVAYVLYTDRTEDGDTVYLRQIFVDRDYRRKGVGREVMRILRDEIWPPDKRITVGVLKSNRAAIAFYRSIGFEPYSIEFEIPARKDRAAKRAQADRIRLLDPWKNPTIKTRMRAGLIHQIRSCLDRGTFEVLQSRSFHWKHRCGVEQWQLVGLITRRS